MSSSNNVLDAVKSMTKAFNNKDMQAVLHSYEEQATVLFEPGVNVSGKAELTEMFSGAFQLNPKFEYPKGHEVLVCGDIALHIAPWTMNARTPDGDEIAESGLSVAVLRKQSDGKWLLVLDNPHAQILLEN
ncbi:YybH family protein [Pseudoalteromonas sp. T1lg65]|uniref:YybH family protein n=1 Tax=Pseudoalteromonas sp. T1lg65 TaxID=2077101 RepID=UPI003F78DA7E